MSLTVSRRLLLGFGAILILMVAGDLFGMLRIKSLGDNVHEIVDANTKQLEQSLRLIDHVQEMRIQYRQLLLDDLPQKQKATQEKYLAARKAVLDGHEKLKQLFNNPLYPPFPEESALLARLQEAIPAAMGATDKTIELAMAGNFVEARSDVDNRAAKMATLNSILRDFAKLETELNAAKTKETSQLIIQSEYTLGMLSLVAVIAGIIISQLITRSITVPLREMQSFMQDLSTRFDFTQRLPVKRRDEIGDSLQAMNVLLDALQPSIRQLHQIGQNVGKAVSALSSNSREMSQAANNVSSSASSMAAGIEEVTVSISHVADQACQCDQTAREAGRQAASGGAVIDGTITSINQIADQVRQSAGQIESLKERTTSISAVVNVIKDIADQTNLLALNAAIEAARAGELGRGFAVVADEVRKLAERTGSSTQEIIATVSAIQNEASSTVQTMQATVRQVDEGVSRAQQASSAINEIRQSADRVVEQVSEISQAMREQSEASSAMAQQVERVAQMSEESSAAAASTADEGRRLQQLGQELEQSIARYRV
ncbi:methyl-accepting chemotaxis protein [Chitinilyticum piscinae]|uniref:Methyl-accepting chemotaxis protein n=1 Tax=Chitinilyticum piscinae TaxID=2866724 RepID=A0A8J7K7E6_9NEIS|nr:methyl-accepting chemotaxis protein [Chitinilyticum piscinae]MBE9607933.1 methyl-accepting chemotaxis protein [Chitinilyticum piscinae]